MADLTRQSKQVQYWSAGKGLKPMERIKPSDLEDAVIKRAVRGYDVVEVHKLLQKAAQEIATLNYEMRQLKTENDKLNPLKDQASALSDVIVSAQKSSDEKIAKAQREGEKIVAAARRESERILAETHQQCQDIENQHKTRIEDLKWHIERTATEKDNIVTTYKRFLKEQLKSIDNSSRKYVTLAVVEGDEVDTDDELTDVEFEINTDGIEYQFERAVEA